jgi:ribosome-associated heat shock protein Hsp15
MKSKSTDPEVERNGHRLDKWLWFARVVKTRTLAARLIAAGKVRVNRERIDKPSQMVRPGAVVTVLVNGRVRILKVLAAGLRRGPPADALQLYEELTPRPATGDAARGSASGLRNPGSGRPTKRDRRDIDRLKTGST